MLLKIRKDIFETNSSSMHSIALTNGAKESPYVPDHDRELKDVKGSLRRDGRLDMTFMDGEDYGWGPEILETPMEKLAYACAEYISNLDLEDGEAQSDIDFIVSAVNLPEVKGFRFPYRSTDWEDENRRRVPCVPAIDHQSRGMLRDYIQGQMEKHSLSEKEALHNFIFDERLAVIITNDNTNDMYCRELYPDYSITFSGGY